MPRNKMSTKKDTRNTNKTIPVCPRCRSTLVKERGMIGGEAYSNFKVCQSCGFEGPAFPEMSLKEAMKVTKRRAIFNPSAMPAFADGVDYDSKRTRFGIIVYFVLAIIIIIITIILWTVSWK